MQTFARDGVCQRARAHGKHPFHRVRDRVDGGVDRLGAGQALGIPRVQKGDLREERRGGDARFGLLFVVVEDGVGRDLAARARRGRDVDHGQDVCADGAGEDAPLAALPREHGDGLGRVHGRPAADGHDKRGTRLTRDARAFFHAGHGGIGRDLIVNGVRLPVGGEGGLHVGKGTVPGRTFAGDDERAAAERGKERRVFADAVLPRHDADGHIKVKFHKATSVPLFPFQCIPERPRLSRIRGKMRRQKEKADNAARQAPPSDRRAALADKITFTVSNRRGQRGACLLSFLL